MQPGNEARQIVRRRVLKAGTLAFGSGARTVECTVRDLSPQGARLRLSVSVPVPDACQLSIELDGLEADCAVVWRKAHEIGVKFVAAPRQVTPRRRQIVTALSTGKAQR
jgi:PilZ domain-containing protein